MTMRTTKMAVTFVNEFTLGDVDEVLPPGTYKVEVDEELLEGLSFQAYRRLQILIYLPAKSGLLGHYRTRTLKPGEFDAALKRDVSSGTVPTDPASVEGLPQGLPKTREAEADRQAVDRAEDEGMIFYPH